MLASQTGKEPRYDDLATIEPAARSGLWDQSRLVPKVEERHFDLILLHFHAKEQAIDICDRWSPEFIAALQANYELRFHRDLYSPNMPQE